MAFSALCTRWGRWARRWALRPSMPLCRRLLPGSSHASFAVSVALSLLLSTAYLRTRALWLSWGLNFGWKASRALLFGLAVSGVSSHSPVVQGDPMGPFWLTGGGYGLDGSWFAFVVLLAALPVVFRLTRDLDFRYNAPVIVPGAFPWTWTRPRAASMRPPWGRRSLRLPAGADLPVSPPPGNQKAPSRLTSRGRYRHSGSTFILPVIWLTEISTTAHPAACCSSTGEVYQGAGRVVVPFPVGRLPAQRPETPKTVEKPTCGRIPNLA